MLDKNNTATGFKRWHEAGFTSELLPIIPPDAVLAEGSSIALEMRGKTPGIKREHGWVGFHGKWSKEAIADEAAVKHWHRMHASTGLQTRNFIAIDLDIDAPKIADAIEELCIKLLGFAPVRLRTGSPRRLLIYTREGEPIYKHRLAFTFKGTKHAVECLGTGQQCVVDGPHPKGGHYFWRHDQDPPHWGKDKLTRVTGDDVSSFFDALAEVIRAKGGEIITKKAAQGGTRMGLDDARLHAPSLETGLKAWRTIKITPEHFPSYDDAVQLIAACKAALYPWQMEAVDDILEHFLTYPGADDSFFFKRWDSVTDAELGWSWLLDVAREHGYVEDVEEIYDDGIAAEAAKDIAINKHPHDAMFDDFTWVQDLDRYFYHLDHSLITPAAFESMNVRVASFGKSGINRAHSIFQNDTTRRRVVRTAAYQPGKPIITTYKGKSAVNLWQPSLVVPTRGRIDVARWLELGEQLFEDDFSKVLDWMAFVYQHQNRKVNFAPLVIGRQGVGKDTFFAPFFAAIGQPDNARMISIEELKSDFNPFMLARVVCVGEMMNFEKQAHYNGLKKYIASPPLHVVINNKNDKTFQIDNLQAWLFMTNHENAVPLEFDDRRFAVYRCRVQTRLSRVRACAIWDWYQNGGGNEQVAAWLLERDVSQFDPMNPPETQAKEEMIEENMSGPVRWLREQLAPDGRYHARTLVTVNEIVEAMNEDDVAVWNEKGAAQQLAAQLRAHGWNQFPKPIKIRGKATRIYTCAMPKEFEPAEIASRYASELTKAAS